MSHRKENKGKSGKRSLAVLALADLFAVLVLANKIIDLFSQGGAQ